MAASDPITFTLKGAQRIERAVREIEKPGQNLDGDRRPAPPIQPTFWAMLTGNDITGLRYGSVRVNPVATEDEADFISAATSRCSTSLPAMSRREAGREKRTAPGACRSIRSCG